MRKILLAAILVAAWTVLLAAPAGAGCARLGWSYPASGVTFVPPVTYFPYPPSPYGVYPYPYTYPYPYSYSYFRPEGPYGWNGARNWRDTWEDDGVKVHGYTLR